MPVPQQSKLPKISVRIDCGDYLLRTPEVDDASERWAGWMADRKGLRLMNIGPKVPETRPGGPSDSARAHPQRSRLETTA
jgi:hypothetical protein